MLNYKIGDVMQEVFTKNTILVHGCNNCDPPVMGSGIAGQIAKTYRHVYDEYQEWYYDNYIPQIDGVYTSHDRLRLGEVQVVPAKGDWTKNNMLAIANLISQQDTGPNKFGMAPVRYEAIMEGLYKVGDYVETELKRLPRPYIVSVKLGAGLGGGDWNIISEMFDNILVNYYGLNVTIYDFPTKQKVIKSYNEKS